MGIVSSLLRKLKQSVIEITQGADILRSGLAFATTMQQRLASKHISSRTALKGLPCKYVHGLVGSCGNKTRNNNNTNSSQGLHSTSLSCLQQAYHRASRRLGCNLALLGLRLISVSSRSDNEPNFSSLSLQAQSLNNRGTFRSACFDTHYNLHVNAPFSCWKSC